MVEQSSGQHKTSLPFLTLIGLGLILLGIAGILLLSGNASSRNGQDTLSVLPAEVNYPAPELSLKDVQGAPASLRDLRGQVILVNLWATWCPPCKHEMPTLEAYYTDHKQDGFFVVAINDGDPAQDVVQFVKEYRLTFPVWLDPTYMATEQAFYSPNLPSSFVIDRAGVVRLRWVGEIARDTLEQYVTPIITE